MRRRLGDLARIEHILSAIREIKAYLKDCNDYEQFASNSLLLNATIRQLEIVGEAANHVSTEVQDAHPEVAWPEIVGLRNLLIHQYFGVIPSLIWQIVNEDLPQLELQMKAILETLPNTP